MGDDFVTVIVKEDGMVSGVEVTESKFVEGMEDDVKVTATSTTFTLSRSLSSSSSTKREAQTRTISSELQNDDVAREVLSPLYTSRKVKSNIRPTAWHSEPYGPAFGRHASKRRFGRRGPSFPSNSEECLLDECSTATDSPRHVRKCVSSSAAVRGYADETMAAEYRRYQSLTWSPTNIRTSSSLFSDFVDDSDEEVENNVAGNDAERLHGEDIDMQVQNPLSADDETHSPTTGMFTWSPSEIRSPQDIRSAEPANPIGSRATELRMYPISRDPMMTFSASSDQGSRSRDSSQEQRDPQDDIRRGCEQGDLRQAASDGVPNVLHPPQLRSKSEGTLYRQSESMEDVHYVIPPEDNQSFEWSPPGSALLSPPVSAITDDTSDLSIPSEVILRDVVILTDDTVDVQSLNDVVHRHPESLHNNFIACYSKGVRRLSKSVGDGATLSDDNLIIRFGEWAAKNPFLGACSPHPGDWDSLQSSSCTDVESSVFSSCCSSTEDAMNLDVLIRQVMDKRLEQHQRSRSNTGSSISDILGEFKRGDEQAILGYSADDENSGRFGTKLRGSQVSTPMSCFSEFTNATTLELGSTTIRTNDLHALTVIMGKWAQTVTREALTPTMATLRELAMERTTPTASNLTFRTPFTPTSTVLLLDAPPTPADSTGACVNESDHSDNWSDVVFLDKKATSSVCTEQGVTSSGDIPVVFIDKEVSSSLETELGIKSFNSGDFVMDDATYAQPIECEREDRESPEDDSCSSDLDHDDDSLVLSQGSSSLWFADHFIEPTKPSTDSSTVLSSELAASVSKDERLRAVIMLSDSSDDLSLQFPSFSLSSTYSTVESDDGLHEELGALNEVRDELRKELENASFIMQSIYPPSNSAEQEEVRVEADLQDVSLQDVVSNLKPSDRTPETSTSSGSVRRVRFSSIVEEFVFIKDARSPSEDSCESFGAFLTSRLENIFCAVRDMVDEWECGTNTSDDYQYPMPPPTPPHPQPAAVGPVPVTREPQYSPQPSAAFAAAGSTTESRPPNNIL